MIRTATEKDAAGIQAIYAPIVASSPITFEYDVPSVEEMASRIRATLPKYPYLVLEEGGKIAGYAYAGVYRSRTAYQWSTEVSVYVHESFQRRGVGTKLYEALFGYLRELGYVWAIAGITVPNPASVAAHEALGFAKVGVFERLGFKQGEWHDVGFWQLELQAPAAAPVAPALWANRQVTCTDSS